VVPPESFFVKAMKKEGPLLAGEIERAASWAQKLSEKIADHPLTEGRAGKPPSFKRGMNRRSLFGVEVGGVFPHFGQRKRRTA
jgi:hypothetical protein